MYLSLGDLVFSRHKGASYYNRHLPPPPRPCERLTCLKKKGGRRPGRGCHFPSRKSDGQGLPEVELRQRAGNDCRGLSGRRNVQSRVIILLNTLNGVAV